MTIEAMGNNDLPLLDVDLIDLTRKEMDVPQQLSDGIHDRRKIQVADCDLVKHGREQEKILPIDEGYLDQGILSEFLVQFHSDGQTRKAPAENEYPFP
jgi:hypothetical protein